MTQKQIKSQKPRSLEPEILQLRIPTYLATSKRIYLERCDQKWANQIAIQYHYKHKKVHDLASPFSYSIHDSDSGRAIGVLTLAVLHFTKQKNLFGYPGLPTKWQILNLSRVWINPSYQAQMIHHENGSQELQGPVKVDRDGRVHSLCIASCAIAQMLKRVNADWLIHHRPRFLDQPYNLELIISYADPTFGHNGTIYKATNFSPRGMTKGVQPMHRHSTQRDLNASRKYIFTYAVNKKTHLNLSP